VLDGPWAQESSLVIIITDVRTFVPLFGGMDIKKPADEEWPSYDDNGTGRVDYLPELS
jgi:hypothetical protein